MINSISNNALQGYNQASQAMQKNASDIARSGTDAGKDVNLTNSVVELKQNQQVAEANLKVLKSENELLGSIIDITA